MMEMHEEQSPLQQWGPYLGALGIAILVGGVFLRAILGTPLNIILGMAGLGVLLIALYVISRPREQVKQALTGHTSIHGTNTLILVVAFIGIVALINFLASKQLHSRVDLTANQQHTLSGQTINVLKGLTDTIQVTAFFSPQTPRTDAEAELNEYLYHTDKLKVSYVDPVQNPSAARSYNITADGTVVFEHGARQEKVTTYDENTLTNALLKVTQTVQPAIYFTTGHGELNPSDTSVNGLSSIQNYLQQINYKVEPLNLAAITATQTISGGLPADTSALVIADPTNAIAPGDAQRIKTYLDSGGRVLLLAGPFSDPGLQDMLATWGITLTKDLVLDPALNYRGNLPVPVIADFPQHAVTQNLNQYGVFFPGVRSLTGGPNGDKSPEALFTTSDQACGKTDLAALKGQTQVQCDPAKDEKGPFTLGYAVEATPTGSTKPSRLIVIGNATFATNQWLGNADSTGNRLLIENVINWLAGQENLIAIPPKDPGTHQLSTLTNTDVNFILWSNVALLPLASILIGGLLWWRRR